MYWVLITSSLYHSITSSHLRCRMNRLVSIVYKPQEAAATGKDYLRVPLESAMLVEGYGIEGDAKGGNPTRNVNIMSAPVLEDLSAEGFRTAPGQMGEQLIIEGLDVN